MEQVNAEIAGLKNELEDLLVARKELEANSDNFWKSVKRQEAIELELKIYEIAMKANNVFETFEKSIPGIEGLIESFSGKGEEIVPRLKSVLSELLGGIKIPETEKPVEPEVDEKTLAIYNAIESFLLAGEDAVALQAMKFKLEQLQRAKSDAVIFYTLDAMKVLLEAGHQKSPMTLFVNLLK